MATVSKSYEILRQWQLARLRNLAIEEAARTMATPAALIASDNEAIKHLVAESVETAPPASAAENKYRCPAIFYIVGGWIALQIITAMIAGFSGKTFLDGIQWWLATTILCLFSTDSFPPQNGLLEPISFANFFLTPIVLLALPPSHLIIKCHSISSRFLNHGRIEKICSTLSTIVFFLAIWLVFSSGDGKPVEGLTLIPQDNSGPTLRTLCAWFSLIMCAMIYCLKSASAKLEEAVNVAAEINAECLHEEKVPGTFIDVRPALENLRNTMMEVRQREEAIADFAKTVIISFDDDLVIETVSPSVLMQWGFFSHDLPGKHLRSIIFAEDFDLFSRNIKDSRSYRIDLNSRLRRGDNRIIDIQWYIERSPKYNRYFASCDDITDRMNLERERRLSVAQLTHDMRSPLSSVNLALSMLKTKALGELSAEAIRVIDRSQGGVARILDLINEILDSEKIRSGNASLDMSPLPIKEVCQEIMDELRPLAMERQVRFKLTESGLMVRGDKKLLSRVLTNILSNAVGFSTRGSDVEISIERAADSALVKIKDYGPGIPLDYQQLIFERFAVAKRRDQANRTSTGLGLSICRDIVSLHGGLIGVDSHERVGSTFWFTLPVADDE